MKKLQHEVDSVIVDLIMEHFNIQSFEGLKQKDPDRPGRRHQQIPRDETEAQAVGLDTQYLWTRGRAKRVAPKTGLCRP